MNLIQHVDYIHAKIVIITNYLRKYFEELH
jgi:hypothetical protein